MKKMMVAIDFSKTTDRTVQQASVLAKSLGARLWVVHVASPELLPETAEGLAFYGPASEFVSSPGVDVEMARDLCAEEYRREHNALLRMSGDLRQKGIDAQALLLKGNAAEQILEQAENRDVEMIIMGSHGHSLLRKMLIGSVTEAVLHKALCNVLIVPMPDS